MCMSTETKFLCLQHTSSRYCANSSCLVFASSPKTEYRFFLVVFLFEKGKFLFFFLLLLRYCGLPSVDFASLEENSNRIIESEMIIKINPAAT
jgi:hypothetical protein